MKLVDAMVGVRSLFLDTAPVIYFVEQNPTFFPILLPIFRGIVQGNFLGVVGVVTLAECLVIPFRNNIVELQQKFIMLLTATEGIEAVSLDIRCGILASELRAKYNIQLPDALQVASAILAGCEAFLTNDIALKRITELRVLQLTELES